VYLALQVEEKDGGSHNVGGRGSQKGEEDRAKVARE